MNLAIVRARRLRTEMTGAERALWRHLRRKQLEGFRFRRQVPIGPFIVDFACHEARLVIEVDGLHHDLSSAGERHRMRVIEAEGYRFLRFSNRDVLKRHTDVLETIRHALLTRSSSSPPPNPPPSRGRALEGAASPSSSPLMGEDRGGGDEKTNSKTQ